MFLADKPAEPELPEQMTDSMVEEEGDAEDESVDGDDEDGEDTETG